MSDPNHSGSAWASSKPWLRGIVGLVSAALVWAQFRGFDLLDAATHFLTYQYPADNPDTHTLYPIFARPLWLLCGSNIVAFRLLCLGLMSGAALVFWRAWRPVLGDPAESAWTGLTLWLSALAGLAWLPVLLGYNSLSTLFALLALAALTPGLGAGPSASSAIKGAVGILLFLVAVVTTALVKPPAALALAAWGGFLVITLSPLPRWLRAVLIILAAVTAAAAFFLFRRQVSATGFDPTELQNIGGVKLAPAWILANLERYWNEIVRFLPALGLDLLFIAPPALGLAIWAGVKASSPSIPPRFAAVVLCVLATAVGAVIGVRGLWDGSFAHAVTGEMARLYLMLWMLLLPAWLVSGFVRPDPARRLTAPLIIAFFFLPLSCGFGSTNTVYFSAMHWTVFWTAGLLLISRVVSVALGEPRLHRLMIVILLLAAGSHLFSGHFLRPYMNQPALWRQNVPVAVGQPATMLKLDPATASFLGEVRGILSRHGWHAGDDLFGFFNLPGVVFALGAKQPGAPWYFGTWYDEDDTDGGKLRNVALERRQRAWIITQADVTSFRKRFRECGIDFPDGYEKIGQTVNPATGLEIGIWKPKAKP